MFDFKSKLLDLKNTQLNKKMEQNTKFNTSILRY